MSQLTNQTPKAMSGSLLMMGQTSTERLAVRMIGFGSNLDLLDDCINCDMSSI